jgi:anti-anti-sigma regulatory factor
MMTTETATGRSVIQLEGVFDGLVARRLEALLARAGAGARFEIDLTHVREFHDFALAVLAHALTQCAASVALRGLRQHQIRLLRYFGVDAGPVGNVALSDAA